MKAEFKLICLPIQVISLVGSSSLFGLIMQLACSKAAAACRAISWTTGRGPTKKMSSKYWMTLKSGQAGPARFVGACMVKINHVDNQSRFSCDSYFTKTCTLAGSCVGAKRPSRKRARNMAAALGQAVGGCEGACCPSASKRGRRHLSVPLVAHGRSIVHTTSWHLHSAAAYILLPFQMCQSLGYSAHGGVGRSLAWGIGPLPLHRSSARLPTRRSGYRRLAVPSAGPTLGICYPQRWMACMATLWGRRACLGRHSSRRHRCLGRWLSERQARCYSSRGYHKLGHGRDGHIFGLRRQTLPSGLGTWWGRSIPSFHIGGLH